MDNNEFRCKVCGGDLVIDDYTLGIAKCLHCSNKTRLSQDLIDELKRVNTPKSEEKVMINMTDNDIEAENKAIFRKNVIYSIKGVIALLSLAILGIYATILYFSFNEMLDVSNIELIVVSVIGLLTPAAFAVFSKIEKKKRESLAVNIFMLIFVFIATGAICYFAYLRYFAQLI